MYKMNFIETDLLFVTCIYYLFIDACITHKAQNQFITYYSLFVLING